MHILIINHPLVIDDIKKDRKLLIELVSKNLSITTNIENIDGNNFFTEYRKYINKFNLIVVSGKFINDTFTVERSVDFLKILDKNFKNSSIVADSTTLENLTQATLIGLYNKRLVQAKGEQTRDEIFWITVLQSKLVIPIENCFNDNKKEFRKNYPSSLQLAVHKDAIAEKYNKKIRREDIKIYIAFIIFLILAILGWIYRKNITEFLE